MKRANASHFPGHPQLVEQKRQDVRLLVDAFAERTSDAMPRRLACAQQDGIVRRFGRLKCRREFARIERIDASVIGARQQQHAALDCRISLIGDHRNDVEAAKANGIRSIAVASGPMPAAELRSFEPDIFIESLTELDIDLLFS